MEYDVIIVGAGASGLMAAIAAARQGSSVLVIEQKEKAGKKIYATGNGKCNFTNLVQNPECYRSQDSAFAMKVLSGFDVNRTIVFFKELGIYPKERNGYLYPNSEQAASIVHVLLMECYRLKVNITLNEAVREIKKPYFTVITETMSEQDRKRAFYHGKKLILATGGCASPKLGSDGSGYQLAKELGHTIIKPLPALVQLKSPEKFLKTVSGVRTDAAVTLYSEHGKLAQETGEILFTDYGISGIPVLQVSRFATKALDKGDKVWLVLDFLPELKKEEVKQLLRLRQNPGKSLEEMMVGLFNHKLSYILLMGAKLDPGKQSQRLNEQELDRLSDRIKEFLLPVNGTNSFDNAQVCAGGVSVGEIDAATMESRLIKSLYFAGELVDVDGTCGGYNLQWAWSSGYLAGTAAGRNSVNISKQRNR